MGFNKDYSGNANISKLLPLFINIKYYVSFRESTWIHFSHVKWIPGKYCQSIACSHPSTPPPPLRIGSYPFSLILELCSPTTEALGFTVLSQLPSNFFVYRILLFWNNTLIQIMCACLYLAVYDHKYFWNLEVGFELLKLWSFRRLWAVWCVC